LTLGSLQSTHLYQIELGNNNYNNCTLLRIDAALRGNASKLKRGLQEKELVFKRMEMSSRHIRILFSICFCANSYVAGVHLLPASLSLLLTGLDLGGDAGGSSAESAAWAGGGWPAPAPPLIKYEVAKSDAIEAAETPGEVSFESLGPDSLGPPILPSVLPGSAMFKKGFTNNAEGLRLTAAAAAAAAACWAADELALLLLPAATTLAVLLLLLLLDPESALGMMQS
jgi:hypothetical protein